MKSEGCVAGDPVWANGVEILSNDECLPLMAGCQVSSILSNLHSHDKTVINNMEVNNQSMDIIIVQNSDFDLNSSHNDYMVLKDNKIGKKGNANGKSSSDKSDMTNLEDLLYFVCNLCPFLCTSNEKISEHLQNAHSNKTVRKREHLKCPACANIFYHKISLRSHLIHDHGVSNSDINKIIKAVTYYAKVKMNEKKKVKVKSKETLNNEKIFLHDDTVKSIVKENSAIEKLDPIMPEMVDPVELKLSLGLPQIDISLNKTQQIFESGKQMISDTLISNPLDTKNTHVCLFTLCRVKMRDVNKLQYHMNSHYDKGFKCSECGQEFAYWSSLSGHLWRSHKIDMELYCCSECEYRTYSLAILNNVHKLIHANVKNFLCNICQKAFKNNKQLRNHKVIHKEKTEKMVHECQICSRKFSDRRQVKLHMDTVHRKLKPFLCSFCGYKSSSRSSLKMHVRQHTGEKPFSCDQCNYATADHNSLRRHKLRHTGDKPYKCAYCSYACIQSSTYKMHLKTKHPGLENDHMFACPECQFRSVNKDMFLSHMASVHKQKLKL